MYGYLPTSSHLVVRPERADRAGFRDASERRAGLPGAYNIYATTTGDPAYDVQWEDLQVLYRPLLLTSFMLDDFLQDHDFFGAGAVVVSSASSKTAYGAAFCLRRRLDRPRVIGLTSQRNVNFTEQLDCYDQVLRYENITDLDPHVRTLYVDVAGSVPLRATIHAHLGDRLAYDAVVGATHLDPLPTSAGDLPGPGPAFFFAPDQVRKRRGDWGPQGVETKFGTAWREFVPYVETGWT